MRGETPVSIEAAKENFEEEYADMSVMFDIFEEEFGPAWYGKITEIIDHKTDRILERMEQKGGKT